MAWEDKKQYEIILEKGLIQEEHKCPPLYGLDFYIYAFHELSTCRNFGMTAGPIPFTAINDYARIYGVEDFDEFLSLIRRMDIEYLTITQNKSQKANDVSKTDSGNSDKGEHTRR